jgi:4-carboxymuconolactone decarboxylase
MPANESSPRIAPLEPPYSDAVAAALARWMPAGATVAPLRLFRTLMVHEHLASRMQPLGAGILGREATVPAELREIAIHRTCALTGAEYEWGVHVRAFAEPLGFSPAQIRSTVSGARTDDCWDARQSCAFALADELHATSTLSDELWSELAGQFEPRQIVELIVTAGWYHLIGYVCNGLRVEGEQWGERFPTPADV